MYYKLITDLIEREPDLYNIQDSLYMILRGKNEDYIRRFTDVCLQIVALYQYVESINNCENLKEAFARTLLRHNFNRQNFIDPREYANSYTFKLKCITTALRFEHGDCKNLAKVVYDVCSSEEYKKLEQEISETIAFLETDRVTPTYSSDLFLPF